MDIGNDPGHRDPAKLLQRFQPRLQDFSVPPELIDDGPLDTGLFLRLQQGHRAVQLSKDAAPVNVAHQQHRRIHQLGKAHVHDVLLL